MKIKQIMRRLAIRALFLAIFLGGGHAFAVTLSPGDLVVADRSGKIIYIDRTSGSQTLIASGGHILDSIGIAITHDGDIFVADVAALGGSIIRVDPKTGNQTVVSTGGIFVNPVGIAIATNGALFVVDDFGRQVVEVDPGTGQQTLISSGGHFLNPFGIAIDAQGDLIISDVIADSVIRVNSANGLQTLVSSGGNFVDPFGIAIGPNGDLVLADANASGGPGAVIVVDPQSGTQTILSSGGSFFNPVGIAVDSTGEVFIGDANGAKVIRVDPAGSQNVLSAGGFLVDVVGVAIVPQFTTPFADFLLGRVDATFAAITGIHDEIKVRGEFTLGPTNDGIDFLGEEIEVGVGTASVLVPAGSLMAVGPKYEFVGVIGGVGIEMQFQKIGADRYKFKVHADGVDLTDTSNPMDILLRVGNDTDTATVRLDGKLKLP